jgi:hypothetical protein
MADEVKKFTFRFITITEDTIFTDQNVWAWKFLNIGKADAKINNGYPLNKAGEISAIFEEPLNTNEKTAQGYKIIFDPTSVPEDRSVLVQQKFLVEHKK